MIRPKIGEKIKIISTRVTKGLYGDNDNMIDLIGKTVTVESIDNSPPDYGIRAGGFIWAPEDIRISKTLPTPKGGTFNIDNLVMK
jgi:hypothetical protein